MSAPRDGFVEGSPVAPHPAVATNLPGVGVGYTRPYNKPWDVAPHRAANEPAKPPIHKEGKDGVV